MRLKFFLVFVSILVMGNSPVLANDPGTPDTVALSVTVDTTANSVVIEVWVYNDDTLTSATVGIGWDNPNMQVDSAVKTPLYDDGFDLWAGVYEDNSKSTTNANRHLIVGAAALGDGLLDDASGRRLWVTYYCTLSSWGGFDNDGITLDTIYFNPSTDFRFVTPSVNFRPIWEEKFTFGNPSYPDPDPGNADTVALLLNVDTNTMSATLELYVYNDETLIRSASGFTWNNQNFQMNTALADIVVTTEYDTTFTFRDNDINATNDSSQFMLGGSVKYPSVHLKGIDPGSNRRKWATYTFDITSWGGLSNDGVTFDTLSFYDTNDTLTFNYGSEFRFYTRGQLMGFQPVFVGAVTFGNLTAVRIIEGPDLPQTYTLSQNYPNPFNPSTQINFEIPVRSHVTLTVYNVLGQKVTTLVDKEMPPGRYVADWNSASDNGRTVASGVYFYKLEAGDFIETKKMMILK